MSEAVAFSKMMQDTLTQKHVSQAIEELRIRGKFKADSTALKSQKPPKIDSLLEKLTKDSDVLIDEHRQRAAIVQDSLHTQLDYLLIEKGYLSQLPFGWTKLVADFHHSSDHYNRFLYVLTVLFGWVLMVVAVSFGAPFWFDLLLKIVNVRNVGKNPSDKS